MNPNNSFYERKMLENMETIEKYGIELAEAKDLDTLLIKKGKEKSEKNQNIYYYDKNVITKSDVYKMKKDSTLNINQKCIVTDLAKEHLRINKIDIKYRD
ncbi:MAG TPA: hypothetical protein DHM42_02950 [Clostridiales bacterium]|jgi:Tfp pilus assembly protein PilE|nr:hypothetical protein [Clostridiales bacterium]